MLARMFRPLAIFFVGLLVPSSGICHGAGDALALERPPTDEPTEPAARTEPPEVGHPETAGEGIGAIIPIDTEITDVTAASVKRRIAEARERGADTIIFELNTPGGLVSSTLDISDMIRTLVGVKTVAWVNTTAHSGGAIVAIACEEIVMARSSRIGDAQVIFGNPVGAEAVPEDLKPKITTPVLAEVRHSAQLRGYSQVLCESFVDPDREVWWIEHKDTGERRFVFRDDKIKLLGETDTEAAVEGADPAAAPAEPVEAPWKLVETYYDILLDTEVDAIQPVVRSDQLLQMSPSEAYAYGFSKGVVTEQPELVSHLKLAAVHRLTASWSESLALWLTSMWVRGFLLVIIMLGAYVEFHTPGVGVPGLVALICLAIFVGAPYLTGLANAWEILAIVVGVLLIALELFVIPGFGIAGISGVILVLVGLLATFVPPEGPNPGIPFSIPSLPSTLNALKMAMLTMVSSLVISLAGMVLLSKYLPKMPLFRQIIPENPTPSEVLTDDPYRGMARIGDTGIAATPLHPSGKARFGPELVDVVTQGEYLDSGAHVEVVERWGNRVVVRAIT